MLLTFGRRKQVRKCVKWYFRTPKLIYCSDYNFMVNQMLATIHAKFDPNIHPVFHWELGLARLYSFTSCRIYVLNLLPLKVPSYFDYVHVSLPLPSPNQPKFFHINSMHTLFDYSTSL